MYKEQVAEIAKSLSSTCKEVVKSSPVVQKLTSPSVALIALTVMNIVVGTDGDPKASWGA